MNSDFIFNEVILPSLEFNFEDNDSFFGLWTPIVPAKKDEVFDSISANISSTNDSVSEIITTKTPLPKTTNKKVDKKKYSFPCPLCSQPVQPYNVKGDELIFMCLNKQCIFPYNMKSQIQEFKTREDKLKKVYHYLRSKYSGYNRNEVKDTEGEHLDPIKKLKI